MSKPRNGLLQEIKSERVVSGAIPKLAVIAQQMDEQDRKDLFEALDDHTISAASISRALKRRGFQITAGSISQYRRGEIAHVIA